MIRITEGDLTFDFPDSLQISQYDKWLYYKNQFMRLGEAVLYCHSCNNKIICNCGNSKVAGTKGVDILVVDFPTCCWLIEIKDFRANPREKLEDRADEMALKVRDTLAAIVTARFNAHEANEKSMAEKALKCGSIRIVFHLQIAIQRSNLHRSNKIRADIKQKLRQRIKAIDSNPYVVDMYDMKDLPWHVI